MPPNSGFIVERIKADISGQHHRSFRDSNTEALELDLRAASPVDTHEQSVRVFIRQPVLFGTKTSSPELKSCSLDILGRDLKAFCLDSSGGLIKASTSSTLSSLFFFQRKIQ